MTGATPVASNLTTPAFTDVGVTDGHPYYYQVLATDSDGNQAPPSRVANATPSGPDGPDPSNFLDNVDSHAYMAMDPPWQITNTAAADGVFSYHNAGDNQTYLAGACASIETPEMTLPAGSTMSFQAQYDVEFEWDGVVTEISTDGGATWADLPPDGGYPSDFSQTQGNGCNFPPSQGAFNGVSTAANPADPGNGDTTPEFLPWTTDLSSFAGESVKIRWRFSSDGGAEFSGFWLDDVRITNGSVDPDVIFKGTFDGDDTNGGQYQCHQ